MTSFPSSASKSQALQVNNIHENPSRVHHLIDNKPMIQSTPSPKSNSLTDGQTLVVQPNSNNLDSSQGYRNLLLKMGIDAACFTPSKPSYQYNYSNYFQQKAEELQKQREKIIGSSADVFARIDKQINEDSDDANMDIDDEEKDLLIEKRKQPLSQEEKNKVQKVLSGPSNSQILIDKFNIDMSREKIVCLRPSTWLNDEAINFYMSMLQERDTNLSEKTPNRKTSHYFNSFFMTKLSEGNTYQYNNVRRWTKKFDIFSKDKIFVPINLHNTHWTMAVVYITKKEIHYYDSMSGSGQRYLKFLLQWIKDDAKDKKQIDYDTSDWKLIDREPKVPQQRNGYDCGMFSIMCADYISDNLPLQYSQDEMSSNRVKVTAAILRGSLSY